MAFPSTDNLSRASWPRLPPSSKPSSTIFCWRSSCLFLTKLHYDLFKMESLLCLRLFSGSPFLPEDLRACFGPRKPYSALVFKSSHIPVCLISSLPTWLQAHEHRYSLCQASASGPLHRLWLFLWAWESLHPERHTGAIPPSDLC